MGADWSIWVEFYPEDPHPTSNEIVRVMYFNGHQEIKAAKDVRWFDVTHYQEELPSE